MDLSTVELPPNHPFAVAEQVGRVCTLGLPLACRQLVSSCSDTMCVHVTSWMG